MRVDIEEAVRQDAAMLALAERATRTLEAKLGRLADQVWMKWRRKSVNQAPALYYEVGIGNAAAVQTVGATPPPSDDVLDRLVSQSWDQVLRLREAAQIEDLGNLIRGIGAGT